MLLTRGGNQSQYCARRLIEKGQETLPLLRLYIIKSHGLGTVFYEVLNFIKDLAVSPSTYVIDVIQMFNSTYSSNILSTE